MKLKPYGMGNVEKTIYLKLKQKGDGGVMVQACDESGNHIASGTLITFRTDGTVFRNGFINNRIGFQLNGEGRIITAPGDC
jgi:hypothetical protein